VKLAIEACQAKISVLSVTNPFRERRGFLGGPDSGESGRQVLNHPEFSFVGLNL
jgi:hypothetical protein